MSSEEKFRTSKKLPATKQWYVRTFLNNLLLLGMLVFMMSPFLTFIYTAGVLMLPPDQALMWTVFHAISSIGIFIGDILHTIWTTSAKRFIYGPMMNSETEGNFVSLELKFYKHLNKAKIGDVIGRDPKTLEEIRVPEEVYAYYVEVVGVPEQKQIWILPSTLEQTFVWHREAAPTKYPVPAWVSYAGWTLLLPVEYEGEIVPVYEVTFSPLIVGKRQMMMPWWSPDADVTEKALKHFDTALAAEYRLKYDNLLAYTKSLVKDKKDAEELGKLIADRAIKLRERVGHYPETGKFGISALKRHKWWIVGIIALILILIPIIYFLLTPPQPVSPTVPPTA